MSQITHKNHYVPQFYLKNWSNNGQTIWTYNILVSDKKVPLWRETAIGSTATLKDFYTREINEKEYDDFEKRLNNDFEMPAKVAIDKVKENVRLKKDDWCALANYVGAQSIRTLARLNWSMELNKNNLPEIMKTTLEKLISDIENRSYIPNKTKPDPNTTLLPLKVSTDNENNAISVKTIVGKDLYLYEMECVLTKTVTKLQEHEWHIIHAADGFEWVTSDDPVICLNYYSENKYDFGGGWGRKGCEIILPLTPKHILYTKVGGGKNIHTFNNSIKFSELTQKLIIEHAFRYIYAKQQIKKTSFIHPRKIDSELFKWEQQSLNTLHDDHLKARKELFED